MPIRKKQFVIQYRVKRTNEIRYLGQVNCHTLSTTPVFKNAYVVNQLYIKYGSINMKEIKSELITNHKAVPDSFQYLLPYKAPK